MDISVKGDFERMKARASAIEREVLPGAMNAALNRGGARGVTESVREAAQEERIPQRKLKGRVRSVRSNFRTMSFRAYVSRQTITYHSLGNPRQTRTGVTVGNGRMRRRLQGAFIANTRSGHQQIFRRKGAERYPLEVPRKYVARALREKFQHHWKHTARPVYVRTLHQEINRRIKKKLNR